MIAPYAPPPRDEKSRLTPLLLRLLGDGQHHIAQELLDKVDEEERRIREAAGRAGAVA